MKVKTKKTKDKKTQLTDLFTTMCKNDLNVIVTKEYVFHPSRKWRFDYAIIENKIALEVEGGTWIQGRHTRPLGFINDMEKYNAATILGWRVLRVTPATLYSINTFNMLKEAINN